MSSPPREWREALSAVSRRSDACHTPPLPVRARSENRGARGFGAARGPVERKSAQRALACLVAALLMASSGLARAADPTPEAQAKTYYDAGVQAYSAGRFSVAVEAFSEAYRLAKKPTLLFSLAQAERREYTLSHDSALMRSAAAHFRQYLEEVKEGGRRTDAVEALGELEAVAARVDLAGGDPTSPGKAGTTSRILITTETKGATVVLDGTEHTESPIVEQVAPGKHKVRVTAPGYVDEEREVVTVQGAVLPVEITLREKPSFVSVQAPVGARVALDGRLLGEAPLAGPLEITAGGHVVTVTKRGHVPYQERFQAARGETSPVRVTLPRTPQRLVSFGVLGGGAAALLTGGGLLLGALDAESTAKRILAGGETANLQQADLDRFNTSLSRRDDLTRASFGFFGAGAALGLTAAALYLFDDPEPPGASAAREADRARVSLSIGPASAGLGITGTF